MNGVEILNTVINDIDVVQNLNFVYFICIGITILCTAISVIIIFVKELYLRNKPGITLILSLSPIWGLILGGVIAINLEDTRVIGQEYIYEMSVSDEVSLNEFTEKYEIISHNGDVYTVREVVMFDNVDPDE